jgi:hypothetical protein
MSKKKASWRKESFAISYHIPSPKEVLAAQSPGGGWDRATLSKWGVSWPPPKGWRKELEHLHQLQEQGNDNIDVGAERDLTKPRLSTGMLF